MLTTNAGNLAARMRTRSQHYAKECAVALRENAETLKRKAQQFSQRRFFSLRDLRKMGHPYAVRAPRPPVRAHILNRQNGRLYQAWRVSVVRPNTDRVTATVYNTAPYSRYMLGTRYMIPRPILDEALARTNDVRARNLKRARDRAYRARLRGV